MDFDSRELSWILFHVNYHSHLNLVITVEGEKFKGVDSTIFQISESLSKIIAMKFTFYKFACFKSPHPATRRRNNVSLYVSVMSQVRLK